MIINCSIKYLQQINCNLIINVSVHKNSYFLLLSISYCLRIHYCIAQLSYSFYIRFYYCIIIFMFFIAFVYDFIIYQNIENRRFLLMRLSDKNYIENSLAQNNQLFFIHFISFSNNTPINIILMPKKNYENAIETSIYIFIISVKFILGLKG